MASPPVMHKLPKEWRAVLAPYGAGYRIKLLSQSLGRKFQERLDPYGLTPFHFRFHKKVISGGRFQVY
jgi:hypothetical protein